MKTIHGAPSYALSNDLISLRITREGGQLAPVHFTLGDRVISPYSLAPWKPDKADADLPVLLKCLRGDFLCLPFGPQQDGPPHGETANGTWELVSESTGSLTLAMAATDIARAGTEENPRSLCQSVCFISLKTEMLSLA